MNETSQRSRWVDDRRLPISCNADVVRLGGPDKFEPVLEARAAAAVDGDAQQDRMALGRAQFGQAPGGAVGQGQAVAGRGRRDLEQRGGLDGAHGGYMRRTGPIAKARTRKSG